MSFIQRVKPRLTVEIVAASLVIIFGLILRLRQYALNLSFWLDEAMLALNITGRSFAGLVRPLDYDQGAPLGFLWSIKLAQVVLGDHEYSLRLLPFLAGCFSLVLLWLVARRLIHPFGMIFALLIFASSRYLVSYTVQVKQYAVDGAVTLLLYFLALDLFQEESSAKKYWLAAVVGGLSIWFSHPSVFTLAGLGIVLIASSALKKDWPGILRSSAVSVFWFLNFVVLYLVQYRNLAANTFLTGFWADYFMPLNSSAPSWTLDRLVGLLNIPGGLYSGMPSGVVLVILFAGLISLFWWKKRWAWMFALSLIFTLVASGLGKYPFGGRMGLFAIPGLFICLGAGLDLPRRWPAGKPLPGVAFSILLMGLLAFNSLTYSVETAFKPKMAENIAPTMAFLKSNFRQDDVIYLYHVSIPAFRYYAPRYGLENARVFNGLDHYLNRADYQSELDQLVGNKRVWLLFSHLTDSIYVQDRDFILDYANHIGSKKREFSDPGTLINLYLFDFTH